MKKMLILGALFAFAVQVNANYNQQPKLVRVTGFIPTEKYGEYSIDEQLPVLTKGIDLADLFIPGKLYQYYMTCIAKERDQVTLEEETAHLYAVPMTSEMVAGSQIANLEHYKTADGRDSIQMNWQHGRPKNGNQPYANEMAIIYDGPDYWEVRASNKCLNPFKGFRVPKTITPPTPPQPKLEIHRDTTGLDMSGFENSGGNSSSVSSASISNSIPISINIIGMPGTQQAPQQVVQQPVQPQVVYEKRRGNAGNVIIPVAAGLAGTVAGYLIGRNNPKRTTTAYCPPPVNNYYQQQPIYSNSGYNPGYTTTPVNVGWSGNGSVIPPVATAGVGNSGNVYNNGTGLTNTRTYSNGGYYTYSPGTYVAQTPPIYYPNTNTGTGIISGDNSGLYNQ